MLHKKFLALTFSIIAVLSMGAVAMAQDDELGFNLTLLNDGDTVESFLSPEEQTRLFVFNGNEGDEVTVSMSQADDSGLDPYLVVLGPQGEILATNDDIDLEGGDYDSLIEDLELPETGTYFVIASSFQFITTMVDASDLSDDELAFELSVEGNSVVEGMEESFNFSAVGIDDSEAVTVETDEDFPVAFLIFEGAEGDEVTINADSDDTDTLLHLFAPGGLRLDVNDDRDFEGGDYNSTIEGVELPEDGLYLVMVTNPFLFQSSEEIEDFDGYVGEIDVELIFE